MDSLVAHLEKLRHFVATAETGSFSKAGVELRLSQPTLSHSVKVLEEVLETSLFLRTSRGVQLTEGGRLLLEEAKKLLNLTESIEKRIRKGNLPGVSPLKVATKEPLAIHFLPLCMELLEGEMPEVTVHRSNAELVEQLLSQNVDAVVLPDPPEREEIISYELYRDRLGLFAPVEWKKKTAPPLYVFRKAMCGNGEHVEDVLKRTQTPFVTKGLDSYEALLTMVVNGLGLGLMPLSIAHGAFTKKEIRLFETEDFPLAAFGSTTICLSVHAAKARDPRIRALVKASRSAAREIK